MAACGQRRPDASRRPRAKMAERPYDPARRRDHRGDRPRVWPRRAAAPAVASLLVPSVRRGDGDGRGNRSRQTPHELVAIGDRVGLDGAALAKASRLVAKVDSAAVQDGVDLYLHGFIVTDAARFRTFGRGTVRRGTCALAPIWRPKRIWR